MEATDKVIAKVVKMVARKVAERVKIAKVVAKTTVVNKREFAMNFATLANAHEGIAALLAIRWLILDGILVVP